MSLPVGRRKILETIRDIGYGLQMSLDRIFFDGLNIRESMEIVRGDHDDGTFDELRALVAEVFTAPREPYPAEEPPQ